jgi:hypothetical protein
LLSQQRRIGPWPLCLDSDLADRNSMPMSNGTTLGRIQDAHALRAGVVQGERENRIQKRDRLATVS